ncbi:MAG: single-stranded DNA-binding protein [Lentisphaeria bacterium]|nr:single-stranded DNA-binding protein [Lentisphaeria bacterium]DAH36297.1 MAG TPA: Single strand binding protein [Caudoviricetes sp.]
MASLNKVLLMGNLTRNPEIRYTPGGSAVCEFGMAINRRFMQANGQEKDETCFVDITVWGKQAESTSRYLQKGSSVFVEGRLVFDQWTEKDTGNKRSRLRVYAERVQFLDRRDAAGQQGGDPDGAVAPSYSQAPQQGGYSRFRNQQPGGGPYGGPVQQQPRQQYRQAPPPPAAPQQEAPQMPEEPPYEPVEGIDDDIPF